MREKIAVQIPRFSREGSLPLECGLGVVSDVWSGVRSVTGKRVGLEVRELLEDKLVRMFFWREIW
jgi:hypothetical protein